jgi:hypothetical protein
MCAYSETATPPETSRVLPLYAIVIIGLTLGFVCMLRYKVRLELQGA